MKKLFITGSTGFIGSHILKHALRKKIEFTALRRSNLSRPVIKLNDEPKWINSDLLNLKVENLDGFDVLLHFASAISPKEFDWNELVRTNILGTSHVIECAAKAGIKRIVLAGTCHEYGEVDSQKQPIRADSALNPINSYGATKAASFLLASAQCKKYNLEMFYGRIFSVFGEGQYKFNFWPSLKEAAINGKDFKMTTGQQVRDFIHVDDVIKIFFNACSRQDLEKGNVYVQNIGSGASIKLVDFASSEWKRFNAKGKLLIGSLPYRKNEPLQMIPDLQEIIV